MNPARPANTYQTPPLQLERHGLANAAQYDLAYGVAVVAGHRQTSTPYIPPPIQILLPSGLATDDQFFLRRSAFRVLLEEFHCIADSQDRLGRVIRDFAAKLLFERHDKLNGVETVGAKVVDETRGVSHLVRLHAKMFYDDLFYPLANVTHFPEPRAPLDWLGRPAILKSFSLLQSSGAASSWSTTAGNTPILLI
jgi:hypothetical protein